MNMFSAWLAFSLAVAPPTNPKFAAMPIPVSSFGAAVSEGWLYVYGGHCGKTHTYSTRDVTGRFFRIRLSGGEWEELPGGPALQGLPLLAYKGKLYRIGGMQPRNAPGQKADNHSVAECAVFDPATRKWAPLPSLPQGRSSHDAAILGDKLVVVGGWNMQGAKGATWHTNALVLDLTNPKASWRSLEQPFRRRALAAAFVADKLHVIGGLGPEGTSRQVDILDLNTATWTKGPSLPGSSSNGFSPSACTLAGHLYASGPDGKIHRLEGTQWRHVATQEVKRFVHRLVPGAEGTILVVGGAGRGEEARWIEEIRPAEVRTASR